MATLQKAKKNCFVLYDDKVQRDIAIFVDVEKPNDPTWMAGEGQTRIEVPIQIYNASITNTATVHLSALQWSDEKYGKQVKRKREKSPVKVSEKQKEDALALLSLDKLKEIAKIIPSNHSDYSLIQKAWRKKEGEA